MPTVLENMSKITSNRWYYLSPVARTTIEQMEKFGFTYRGIEDDWDKDSPNINGWILEPRNFCLVTDMPNLLAIWTETGDSFAIELYQFLEASSQRERVIADGDIHSNPSTPVFEDWEDQLASDIEAALEIAIKLVKYWTHQHMISPGQLELFSTEDFCRDSQGQPARCNLLLLQDGDLKRAKS